MTQEPEPPSRSLESSRMIFVGCAIIMMGICRASDLLTHWPDLVAERDQFTRLLTLILPVILVVFFFLSGAFIIWRSYRGTGKRDE